MQTLKSLILKLDGVGAGCRCTPQISFPYTRMCHLFRFSFLPWWKCPVQSQGQLQNVWDFILPRVRNGNLSQNVEMEQSVSKALKKSRRVTVRAATQLWDNAESEITNLHLAFPINVWGCSFASLTHVCFGSMFPPKCYFPTQNQYKFTLHD